MAEPTLTLSRTELRLAVADFLGYGRTAANWTTAQGDRIGEVINDGLRMVYSPPVLPNERSPHKWSFLYPVHAMQTAADQHTYPLPDDFGGLDGTITFSAGSGHIEIPVTGENRIREHQATMQTSGVPRLAAVRTQRSEGETATKYDLLLYPTPDAAYTLTFRYRLLADALTEDRPYPVGASLLSQFIKEACLAAAEMALDNEKGLHWTRYVELARDCVAEDRANMDEQHFGFNADYPPTAVRDRNGAWRSRSGPITYA